MSRISDGGYSSRSRAAFDREPAARGLMQKAGLKI
jgi:hypothetical protein